MFKSLKVGDAFPSRASTVVSIKDWADGSRTVRLASGTVITRKANVSLKGI